ncbi:hypothetical protein ACHHYP_05220 [Achlya hypogyna]|uniref:GRAM domain-containing protein n=1 Tax=Achlya hypogyna TaxID=1202772 RepID=A0A1V9YZ54_ACHHY|nr:hypothetical protein ACHHYP_05220 [Achlya hypogyna]
MSFTPQLFSDKGKSLPLANTDEVFILERPAIAFQCIVDGEKFKGNGRIYITTQRLVFCADKGSDQHGRNFQAYEIPLDNITENKFNQPIFGSCNITGDVIPVGTAEGTVATPNQWKLSFNNGGTGTFLPVFLRLMEHHKRAGEVDETFADKQRKAYVDPNDPTVIYVSQPPPLATTDDGDDSDEPNDVVVPRIVVKLVHTGKSSLRKEARRPASSSKLRTAKRVHFCLPDHSNQDDVRREEYYHAPKKTTELLPCPVVVTRPRRHSASSAPIVL